MQKVRPNTGFECLRTLLMFAVIFMATTTQASAQGFTMSDLSLDLPTAYAVTSADLDGDADLDVAATGMSAGLVAWIENRGQSTTTHQIHFFANGVRGITSGDFDGDGDTDLVVAAYGENRIVLFRNVGGGGLQQFESVTVYQPCAGIFAVRAGDFDGDGDADLLATDYRGNVARLFLQQNGGLQQAYAVSVPSAFDILMADFDRDGDQDIVVQSEIEGLMWIEQVAPLSFSLHELGIGADQVGIAAADVDGDSDLDIVASSFSAGRVIWWERTAQSFVSRPLPGAIPLPRGVGIADFDDDGALDVVATGQQGDVVWWRRDGSNYVLQPLTPGSGPHGLCVTDLDRDGDPDVLVADYWASTIRLYRNTMGVPAVISGAIRSESSGSPISGARVRLVQNGVVAVTDGLGRFTAFTRAGTYTVEVTHPCWNPNSLVGVEAVSGDTSTVEIPLVRAGIVVGVTSLNLMVPNHDLRTAEIPVRNTGDGVLQVRAEAMGSEGDRAWLSVLPSDLSLLSGDSAHFTVTVSPDTSDESNWDYYGEVWLHANTCPDSVLRVAVLVYVLALDAPKSSTSVPARISLHPAYPNPFNGQTRIAFDLDQPQTVRLTVFDVTGARTAMLVSQNLSAGAHEAVFDATNLPSGVYLIALETPQVTAVEKVFLIK